MNYSMKFVWDILEVYVLCFIDLLVNNVHSGAYPNIKHRENTDNTIANKNNDINIVHCAHNTVAS